MCSIFDVCALCEADNYVCLLLMCYSISVSFAHTGERSHLLDA